MTVRWFTDADLAERARIRQERLARDELMFTFATWLEERVEHDGPFTVPELSPEMETRLLQLLRPGAPPPQA